MIAKNKKIAKVIPEGPDDIKELTTDQLAAFKHTDRMKLFNNSVAALYKAEEEGRHNTANKIRNVINLQATFLKLEGDGEDIRRQDWDNNHMCITNAIRCYLLNDNYSHLPTLDTIAKTTKLSRQTVNKHLRAGIANQFHQERIKYYECLTTDIFTKLYKLCLKGNVAAGKVFLENIYKPTQQPATNIKQQNNYLQINNTRIDEVTVNELPESARQQIENIITQYSKKTA